MDRQKKYYDQILSWQSFQPGDQVFVFFPNVKPRLTTKLACLWRGPFKVIAKITDVTYKINCGRKGKPQVIHGFKSVFERNPICILDKRHRREN